MKQMLLASYDPVLGDPVTQYPVSDRSGGFDGTIFILFAGVFAVVTIGAFIIKKGIVRANKRDRETLARQSTPQGTFSE